MALSSHLAIPLYQHPILIELPTTKQTTILYTKACHKRFSLSLNELGYITTESTQIPPFVWVQSICIIENFNWVCTREFFTTKSPAWQWSHCPGSSRKHWETVRCPSEVESWKCVGLTSHPWICSVLQSRRPNFLKVRPICTLKNTLYVPSGNGNSTSPLTSNHQIC